MRRSGQDQGPDAVTQGMFSIPLLANDSFCSFAYFVSEPLEYFLTISEFSQPYLDFFSMVSVSFLNNFIPIVSRSFVV